MSSCRLDLQFRLMWEVVVVVGCFERWVLFVLARLLVEPLGGHGSSCVLEPFKLRDYYFLNAFKLSFLLVFSLVLACVYLRKNTTFLLIDSPWD
jgi:hypothetical protein